MDDYSNFSEITKVQSLAQNQNVAIPPSFNMKVLAHFRFCFGV